MAEIARAGAKGCASDVRCLRCREMGPVSVDFKSPKRQLYVCYRCLVYPPVTGWRRAKPLAGSDVDLKFRAVGRKGR